MVKSANSSPASQSRPVVAGSTRSSLDATPIQMSQTIPDRQFADKARQRAATRDNQIRKSAGMAISKQSRGARLTATPPKSGRRGDTGALANAVANYELCDAETILESNTIVEAARHMAAKRLDFVLVVDGTGRLVGIITDRDLAFRVVAENLDPRQTIVSQIMTRDPQCVQSSTSMIDALTKMVQNHFRHLPVMEEEKVVGVLDIAKCLYDALQKLELADAAANQIAAALETVGKEFGGVADQQAGNNDALTFADSIRDCLTSPKLSSIVGEDPTLEQRTIVNVKCSVVQAVKLMKGRKETASLVTDEQGQALVGIFTTKDILLRVVAAGLDPATTTIIRVMTPHPDSATPEVSIVAAIRQMHSGHYLHLPILTAQDKSIVGVVDVLQLTYSMLEQLSALKGNGQTPLWHQLWSPDGFCLESESIHGTASQYSERISDYQSQSQSHGIAFVPRPASVIDDFAPITSAVMFKVKYGSEAILISAENTLQLPQLHELEAEVLSRFKIADGALHFVDEDLDLIPIRDDVDLGKFVQIVTASGKDRVNLVLIDGDRPRLAAPLASKQGSLAVTSHPAVVGAGLAILGAGLASLAVYLLRAQRP